MFISELLAQFPELSKNEVWNSGHPFVGAQKAQSLSSIRYHQGFRSIRGYILHKWMLASNATPFYFINNRIVMEE